MVKVKHKHKRSPLAPAFVFVLVLLGVTAIALFAKWFPSARREGGTATRSSPGAGAVHRLTGFDGETVRLRRSVMPTNGFGTCCRPSAKGEAIYASTSTYLRAGGRLVDTAMAYGNHREIGRAVRDSGLGRDEVWITSKISPNQILRNGGRGGGDVQRLVSRAVDGILKELGTSYLDLCLIHTPKAGRDFSVAAWRALVEARNDGRIRSIGVSNFNKEEILDLRRATGETPEVNQIQYHPWTSPEWRELVRWHQRNDVVTIAYNSLGGSRFRSSSNGRSDDAVLRVAERHAVSEAQLLLRWATNHDKVAVIPGATSEAHVRENLDAPPLPDLDPTELEGLDPPPGWFDAARGPGKYAPLDAFGPPWTGDHTLPKKKRRRGE